MAHSSGFVTAAQNLRTILSSNVERKFNFSIDMKKRGRAAILADIASNTVFLTLSAKTVTYDTEAITFIKIKDFTLSSFTY